jgi:endo-1,4-beta-xylanase
LEQLGIDHQYGVVPDVAHDSARYYRMLGPKAFQFHREAFEAIEKGKTEVQ